jgi:phosphatidylglycerol:prolipoprotein diacylglycerol transferase
MHPVIFTLNTPFGELPFPVYGLMMTLAVLAASLVGHVRSKKVGINPDQMVPIYLICVTAGIAGSRLLHFIGAEPEKFFANPFIFFDLSQGGLAVYGGLIGGFLAVWAWCARQEIPFWKVADIMAPAVILGVSIGRIGCFFAGCCHGQSCELPLDVATLYSGDGGKIWWSSGTFPHLLLLTHHGVGVNDKVVYPTQLWESAATLVIFLLSSVSFRYRKFDGQVVATVAFLYAIWRPINEAMRGDTIRGTDWFGLTTSQAVSIPVFLGALLIIIFRASKGVAPEKEYVPDLAEDDLGSAPRL